MSREKREKKGSVKIMADTSRALWYKEVLRERKKGVTLGGNERPFPASTDIVKWEGNLFDPAICAGTFTHDEREVSWIGKRLLRNYEA